MRGGVKYNTEKAHITSKTVHSFSHSVGKLAFFGKYRVFCTPDVDNTRTLENYFNKTIIEEEEHHPLSDDEEDDNTEETAGEFRRMLKVTRLLSYFPKI